MQIAGMTTKGSNYDRGNMNLTQDQEKALAQFNAFMISTDKYFVLSGGAGTGKSTLLKYLSTTEEYIKMAELMGIDPPNYEWCFTATTNKAAEVLARMGFPSASTVHNLFNITVSNDYGTGETKIHKKKNFHVLQDKIIVIDEWSMIDTPLLRLLDEGTLNCKFIFVGDHCQMPPVKEAISPVMNLAAPIVLNEIMRSKNAPPITDLALQLRETVETGVFQNINEVPGFIEYLDPDQAKMKIREYFVHNSMDARILTYTNRNAIDMNRWIRQEKGLPDTFVPGDRLVSNTAYKELRIEDEVTVERVSEVYSRNYHINGQAHELYIYTIVTKEGHGLEVAMNSSQLQNIIKVAKSAKDWKTYFHLKENIVDLRPRDACTVYKAQGSTYGTVFVNLSDIGTCTVASQAARLLYVACSRPEHRIYLLGDLPARFKP